MASQYRRPRLKCSERGASEPGRASSTVKSDGSGGDAGMPVSASSNADSIAFWRFFCAVAYSCSYRDTSFWSSQTDISRSLLYRSRVVRSSWLATPSTRTKSVAKWSRWSRIGSVFGTSSM